MKRWLTLAACVVFAAGCQDGTAPVVGSEPATPRQLLGLTTPSVTVDPVLRNLLNVALPTDRLEVLVTYDPASTTGDAVASRVRLAGAGIVRFRHLPVVAAVATPLQLASITGIPGVKSVFSNKQLRYHLRESVASIRADVAHAHGYTGKGVGIAILDSGIDGLYNADLRHPTRTVANLKIVAGMKDLALFGPGQPAIGGDLWLENLPTSETTVGHGTHVAGIAAGDGTSSNGTYTGVAPGANLVGLGSGDILFVFWQLAAFDWLLENHGRYNIQVVNNSWGTTGEFIADDPINIATKQLYDAGVAVVFSAGNEGPGENTLNPYSAAPWVISVAAGCKTVSPDPTDSVSQCNDGRDGLLGDFSSRGRNGDPLVHPDIVAPGVNIVSTRALTGTVLNALDAPSDLATCSIALAVVRFYTCSSGTSMSAPHVTGAIALLEEAAGGNLTPAQAYAALTSTARPMPGYGEWEVGAGYMDVYAAIKAVTGRQ
ncbi:MAG TPA: S8 family serine peptidase [Longimicrobium sp.]|nr:S8 family serine peptidase [Longimicrobium sp.]